MTTSGSQRTTATHMTGGALVGARGGGDRAGNAQLIGCLIDCCGGGQTMGKYNKMRKPKLVRPMTPEKNIKKPFEE